MKERETQTQKRKTYENKRCVYKSGGDQARDHNGYLERDGLTLDDERRYLRRSVGIAEKINVDDTVSLS